MALIFGLLQLIWGHKDITQITKTYGHLIKEKAEKENNRIREFLAA